MTRVQATLAETRLLMSSNIMKFRYIVICLLSVALLGSCGGGKPALNEQQEAIVAEMTKDLEGDFKFTFNSFEKIDSTTMRTEVQRRLDAFSNVLLQNYRLYNGYVQNNKPKNAAHKMESIQLDTKMLQMLENYMKTASGLDDVAYYDYKFSAVNKRQDGEYNYPEAYAAITPDNQVIAISTNYKNLHAATGKVIPGYSDLLQGADEESDEEIEE